MSKIGEYIIFKIYERKTKSLFMTYSDFASILISEDNGNQNPDASYTNKYQMRVALLVL